MRALFPRRPSPATVISLLALFVALGGLAWAATSLPKNSVRSKQIKNGQVKTADIAGDAVTGDKILESSLGAVPIADDSINGSKVKDNSLTGADIDEASLAIADNSINGSKVTDDSLGGADIDEASLALGAEAWHEIGAGGEPAFRSGPDCRWKNYDAVNFNAAAFLRDRSGFVHLKGLVAAEGATCAFNSPHFDELMFTLPLGYRPAATSLYVTLTNNALGRLDIEANGQAHVVNPPTTLPIAKVFVQLDGISFRCAPSGANGCP